MHRRDINIMGFDQDNTPRIPFEYFLVVALLAYNSKIITKFEKSFLLVCRVWDKSIDIQ